MSYLAKVVLHCPKGIHGGLAPLVHDFMRHGIKFVAVAGPDASLIEAEIDETCVGDSTNPYDMLTSCHPNESISEVVAFAEALGLEFAGPVQVVEF